MLLAFVWLSACLAIWTSAGAFADKWGGAAPLAGWLALCIGVAALFGVALRFVVISAGVIFLLGVVSAIAGSLSVVFPPTAVAITFGVLAAIGLRTFVRRLRRRPEASSPADARVPAEITQADTR
jgi:hypothetical protein